MFIRRYLIQAEAFPASSTNSQRHVQDLETQCLAHTMHPDDELSFRERVDAAAGFRGPRLNPTAKLLHHCLTDHRNATFGACFPGEGLLVAEMELSTRTVRNAIAAFKAVGAISVVGRTCGHGKGVALVLDCFSAPWLQGYAPLSEVNCLVSPRIKFEHEDGSLGRSPGTGTAVLHVGEPAASAPDRCALGLLA